MYRIQSGKIFRNFIALILIQGTNFLLPLLVMPYVISKIGPDGFGIVSVAQVVMFFLSTLVDYGFNLSATRDIALYRNDPQKISRIFSIVIVSKAVITLICAVILILLVIIVPLFNQNVSVYAFAYLYVIGQAALVNWFYQGIEKMEYITIISLVSRLIFVALVFLFIKQKSDNVYFLFFLGLGNILAGLLSIILAIRIFKVKIVQPLKSEVLLELKEGWQLTVSNLSINTYQYINIFILRLFTNDAIVGYYSIAEKIFFAFRQMLGIFSQVIYPRVCQLAIQSRYELKNFFRRIYLPFLGIVFLGSVIVFIFSPLIIKIFIPDAPKLPVLILRMLSFVPVIVCLNIPAYQLLLAFNSKKEYFSILISATIINILANLILCNIWGAIGTATAIILTELFVTFGLNLKLYNKLINQ